MLTSLALIFLCGLVLGSLFSRCRLPALLGMLATGMLLGPWGLDWLDAGTLALSPDLRRLALVIILIRAGLAIAPATLGQNGRAAGLLCFLPAACEIVGIVLLAPLLLGIAGLDAAILGTTVAAGSPAVVAPAMLRLEEQGYGRRHRIPQMLMASASVDGVFAVVLFTSFLAFARDGAFSLAEAGRIPVAIVSGIAAGMGLGLLLPAFFRRFPARDSIKVIIVLSLALLLLSLENGGGRALPFSGLLAATCLGIGLRGKNPPLAARLGEKFSKLWLAFEILLFALVGAAVDPSAAIAAGGAAAALICGALAFRMLGVLISLARTAIPFRERLFCLIALVPKATVQAVVGGIPLALGLPYGKTVLTVSVLSILIAAPLGALGIAIAAPKLLSRD